MEETRLTYNELMESREMWKVEAIILRSKIDEVINEATSGYDQAYKLQFLELTLEKATDEVTLLLKAMNRGYTHRKTRDER